MEFYKNWLQKNTEANQRAKRRLQQIDGQPTRSTSNQTGRSSPIPSTSASTSRADPIPSTSGDKVTNSHQGPSNSPPVTPTDLVYEDNDLKLIVKKGFHQRQKAFKLQVLI